MARAAAEAPIRRARPADSAALTRISFASKRHWGYPEAYFAVWREELTVGPEYIRANPVFLAERDGVPVAYYSLVLGAPPFAAGDVRMPAGDWLEHMFVGPDCIGRGVGRRLARHLARHCQELGVRRLMLLADPHASGFYRKCGAVHVKDVPSNIPGRKVAYFEWDLA